MLKKKMALRSRLRPSEMSSAYVFSEPGFHHNSIYKYILILTLKGLWVILLGAEISLVDAFYKLRKLSAERGDPLAGPFFINTRPAAIGCKHMLENLDITGL